MLALALTPSGQPVDWLVHMLFVQPSQGQVFGGGRRRNMKKGRRRRNVRNTGGPFSRTVRTKIIIKGAKCKMLSNTDASGW